MSYNTNFYLPDFYNNCNLICFIADMMEQAPECFYEGVKIPAAYGCFPNSIWNGGRTYMDRITKNMMEKTISELNSRGIAVRYTFTNPVIEEKHLNDTFCNLCLELAKDKGNEVLVNSPLLENYIRENYPSFKLISSTTKCLSTIDEIAAELEKDYYLVVLDSAMNSMPEIFNLEHRDRLEVLVNHRCEDNCPRRRAHYIHQGKSQLEFAESSFPACQNLGKDFYQLMYNKNFLTNDMIFGKFSEGGFHHFKLDGRGWGVRNVVESFVYYLVKPEWRDKVRQVIFREIYRI